MFADSDHTFVVCAYGESSYLYDCVASLMNQTIKSNLIIATTTPNNRIRTIAKDFDIPLIVNDGEPGIAHDWNCALSNAGTSLVTIAHQDDSYSPRYVECVLDYCNNASHPLIFFTDYGEIRNGIKVDITRMLRIKRMMLRPLMNKKCWGNISLRRRLMSFGSPICCPSVTYHLPNLMRPVFHEGMRGGLDWDAWERISKLDGDFVYAPEILMHHRIHEMSETSALIKDDIRSQEDYAMFCRFWPRPVARILNKLYGLSLKSNTL